MFYPVISPVGTDLSPYGSGNDAPIATPSDEAAAVALETEFDPVRLNGVYGLYFDSSANNHVNCGDDADFSHGNATVDTAFSIGMWVLMTEALGTARSLLAKYRTDAVAAREYDFRFGADGKLVMELYDESATATEIATSTGTALTPWVWQFVTMTYDGNEAAPVINLYVNATSVHDGTSVETGAYVAMEDTATGLLIGARNITTAPAQEFEGYMALPFLTGQELTAANVTTLYNIGRRLLGLL